ncbi:MAG TPA: hypothetical protein VE396_00840 [Xanthobacteraceae bacterium]|jgi:hypothetical protein|nr:hypothetical protein [Xanthobacteraceae bacterium]
MSTARKPTGFVAHRRCRYGTIARRCGSSRSSTAAAGAAISAQTVPKIGTVLALATIVSRVVRHFDGGFAVRFIERQNLQHIEARVNLDLIVGYGLE